jgi:hypothetical protein
VILDRWLVEMEFAESPEWIEFVASSGLVIIYSM